MTSKKKFLITLTLITFIVLLSASYPVLTIFYSFSKEPASLKTVFIPKNTPVIQAANILEKGGVIESAAKFKILVSILGKSQQIKPGEYEFKVPDHPINVLKKIVQGKVKGYKFTVPEGLTIREIAKTLEEQKLADKNKFIALMYSKELLTKYSIKSPSLEGYLFPETYILDKTMSEKNIMEIMIKRFFQEVTPELINDAGKVGMTLHDTVTLASMIEKETGTDDERPFISSVFHNRLLKKMRLQCDPTVIYGILETLKESPEENPSDQEISYKQFKAINAQGAGKFHAFSGNLKKIHLETKTPYNTYLIKGLPKGPISNPGLASIKAAIFPKLTTFLFFVAKNDGSHIFSQTYRDHLDAVRKFQLKGKGSSSKHPRRL